MFKFYQNMPGDQKGLFWILVLVAVFVVLIACIILFV